MAEFPDDDIPPKSVIPPEEVADMRATMGDEHAQAVLNYARLRVQQLGDFMQCPSTLQLRENERGLVFLILLAIGGEIKPFAERLLGALPPAESSDEFRWRERFTILLAEDASKDELFTLLDEIVRPRG